MMALNAVDEPILIRLIRHEMIVVTMIEMSGIFIRGSTCARGQIVQGDALELRKSALLC